MFQASKSSTSDYLAWIDFGIFHIIKDIPKAYTKLKQLQFASFPTDKIISPGGSSFSFKFHTPNWKFLGGILISHTSLLESAWKSQQKLVMENLPVLSWEINYWYLMSNYFITYPANHDDSILDVEKYILNYVKPYTSVSTERIQNVLDTVEY